jgi:hypothetical protein
MQPETRDLSMSYYFESQKKSKELKQRGKFKAMVDHLQGLRMIMT